MPEIIVAKTAGFCFGVNRAVNMVTSEMDKPGKVYTYGPIVHNEVVTEKLSEGGVSILNSLEDARAAAVTDAVFRTKTSSEGRFALACPEEERLCTKYGPENCDSAGEVSDGRFASPRPSEEVFGRNTEAEGCECGRNTVVIRAHGVSADVEDELKKLGYNVVDATCPFVRKIHEIVARENSEGRRVIIVGNPNHPEVQGIAGRGSVENVVIESFEDFEKLKLPLDKSYSLVAQTTFNYEKLNEIIDKLKILQYDIRCFNTVCNATHERQREAAEIAGRVDAMIVIGSRNSSNTRKLYEICKEKCDVTVLIQDVDDLTCEDYHSVNSVGITAGASTPKHIIEEVQTYVRS